MKNARCEQCLWFDKCGCDETCEWFESIDFNDADAELDSTYNRDLTYRQEFYNEQIEEQNA